MKGMGRAILGLSLLLAGCAADRVNLAKSGDLRIVRPLPSGMAWVEEAWAYQEGPDILVSGKLARQGPSPVLGHVDVVLKDPDGAVIAQGRTGPFRMLQRRGPAEAPFWVRLRGITPAAGGVLEVSYHGALHLDPQSRSSVAPGESRFVS